MIRRLIIQFANIVQMHSTSHHSSCTKGYQRIGICNQCRFGLPADICHTTELVRGACKLKLKRTAHIVYLKPFNSALIFAVWSNNDEQLLLGTGEYITLYYVFKYIIKCKIRVDQLPPICSAGELGRLRQAKASNVLSLEHRAICRRILSAPERTLVSDPEIGSRKRRSIAISLTI